MTQHMKASCYARQKNRRGAAPKDHGGKHHKGETANRGTPPANTNTPPTASPLQEGHGARLAEVGEDPLGLLRETRAPPTAGSCSHRVAEKLYASK